eukprot:CAMPEP_0198290586 /NCGR_PEP_ID=MMETSP1449-20131203/8389_1 /TAXON_ID=420275 /ORGANISM="Attheya septentrionalis, Strain CCMP2084" /LENGTH=446 /DNA_ID=CAMNT_0043989101 /DNA_START=269 /DNA_END=1609 /DNA_ORIENTATION=-
MLVLSTISRHRYHLRRPSLMVLRASPSLCNLSSSSGGFKRWEKSAQSSQSSAYPSVPSDVIQPSPPDTWISDTSCYIDAPIPSDSIIKASSTHAPITGQDEKVASGSTMSRTDKLNNLLRQLKLDTGAEFAIVALDDLGRDHAYGSNPDQAYGKFCRDLFDEWGVGRKDVNDGMLLVVFRRGRRVELVNGKGLAERSSRLRNEGLFNVQSHVMRPLFRQDDFGGAIEAGALELVDAIRTSSPTSLVQSSSTSNKQGFSGGGGSYQEEGSSSGKKDERGFWMLWAVLAGVMGMANYINGHKGLKCRKCGAQTNEATNNMSDKDLEDFLSPCEKKEQELGSCSFELRHCPQCNTNDYVRMPVFASVYHDCSACGCCTATHQNHETVAPTYISKGQGAAKVACHHCDHHDLQIYSISKLEHGKSSSSSDGGDGFSGGSSAGGSSAGTSF